MPARLFVLGALTLASAVPAGLAGQERQQVSRPRIFIDGQGPELIRDRIRLITERRARLGVTIDMRASETDSIGASIQSVTPGGPAAKVGLRSGDIITQIDGKSLTASDNTRAGEEESLPGVRLAEYAAQLKPNATVKVVYRRDRTIGVVSLVTGNEPVFVSNGFDDGEFTLNVPGGVMRRSPLPGGVFTTDRGPGGAMAYTFTMGGPLADLELAPLNPDLGAYFGTTEGVLVVNVPRESTLGLKGGDVILSVDGRKATGPGGFLRILRSYDPGDTFKLDIMRNKARTSVSGQLEKTREREPEQER